MFRIIENLIRKETKNVEKYNLVKTIESSKIKNQNDDEINQISFSFERAREVANKLKQLLSLNDHHPNYRDAVSQNLSDLKRSSEINNENNSYLDYSSLYNVFKKRVKTILEYP